MQKNNWTKIFNPAVLFLNHLNYIWKFLLISFLFIFPLVLATYFFISERSHDVKFAEKERLGVQYILPVKKFLQNVQQHRGMVSAYLNGDESFAEKISTKKKEILANVEDIDAIDRKLGKILGTTDRWFDIKRQWGNVRSNSAQSEPIKNFEMHSDLIQQIIVFIARIGDYSNLTLDPDLDSYYIMDAFVNQIPFISERLGQLRAFGLSLSIGEKISVPNKLFVENLLSLSKISFQKMNDGMEVAYRYNPSIKQLINLNMEKSIDSINSFHKFISVNIVTPEVNNINPLEYYDEATAVINEIFNLYDKTSPILDDLLEKRIYEFEFQGHLVLTVISVMFVVVFYLFAGFYVSIRKTISELSEISDGLMNGKIKGDKIKLSAKDELGKIGDLFAKIGGMFIETNKALKEDISKRKEAEEKLKSRTEELEKMNKFMINRELKMVELKEQMEKVIKERGGNNMF